MATDIERLVVSLDANVNGLMRQLKRAGVELESFERDADRTTRRARKKIEANLDRANDNRGGIRQDQITNLRSQLLDVGTSLSGGASPLQVISQQGAQVYEALASGPGGAGAALKELLGRFTALVTPARLVAGGVAGIGAAAAFLGIEWSQAQKKVEDGLSGIGRRSGATVNDINRVAEAVAATGTMSTGAAREAAALFAQTGDIDRGQLESVTRLVPGYAKLVGKSANDAALDLAKMFADPAKGADELAGKLGTIDDKTRQYVRTLAAQGDSQAAIRALIVAVQPELDRAAAKTSAWARAWNALATAADAAGKAVVIAATPAPAETDEQKLARLMRARAATGSDRPAVTTEPELVDFLRKSGATEAQIAAQVPTYRPGTTEIEKEIDALRSRIDATKAAEEAEAQRLRAIKSVDAAAAIVRQFDQAGEAIKRTTDEIALLEGAIAAMRANPTVEIEGGLQKTIDTSDALKARLALLKDDHARGGTAAQAALRQANFQAQTAGLSSYAKGLAEIRFRFDEMREAARRAADTKSLPVIEQQREAAISGLNAANVASADLTVRQGGSPYEIARTMLGTQESSAGNPVGAFIRSAGIQLSPQDAAWCAAFANAALMRAGLPGTGSNLASSFQTYGQETQEPRVGDIVVLRPQSRDASGHVGFFQGYDAAGRVRVLGGNQSVPGAERGDNGVTETSFATDQVVSFRRVGNAGDRQAQVSTAAQQRDRVLALQAEANAVGKAAAEVERLRAVEELLADDRQRGGALSAAFVNATDLIRASSEKLTPELAKQRDEWLRIADARAKAAQSGVQTRFDKDIAEARAALGRTSEENQAYRGAERAGFAPGTAEFQDAYGRLSDLQGLQTAKSETSSFLKGLNADLSNSAKLTDALANAWKRMLSSFTDRALDSAVSRLFAQLGGGGGSGSGGLASLLSSFFGGSGGGSGTAGFADIGNGAVMVAGGGRVIGPGSGTSDSIAARLSSGEFVVNAAATREHQPILEAINARRFSKGGPVGFAMPRIPKARPAAAASGPGFAIIDQRTMASPEPEVRRGASGNTEIVLRDAERGLARRAQGGRGPFGPVIGGAGSRRG